MSVAINIGVTYNGKNIKKSFDDLNQLRKLSDNTGDRLKALGGQIDIVGRSMEGVGRSLTKNVTLPIVGLGTLAVRSSVDFDTAFTNVIKTVDATEEQLSTLRSEIRKMSTELPATASEIANVASAAGQLGISTDNILSFTKVMIDLGETTNLSADDAATALARFANIVQMPQENFDRLGSTIAALGNNMATTEREIVELGLRLAAAGSQVGLNEAQILAFAAALSSVGVEAEAGGSAFSRVFLEINSAVISGGDSLERFALIAGLSAEQFVEVYRRDAAEAITMFVRGLRNVQAAGGDMAGVLGEVGFDAVRLRDILGRAAGAGDLLTDALQLGNDAFAENTALVNEANLRYGSSAAQLDIFRNRLNDVRIEMGDALIPALLGVLESLRPLIDRVKDAVAWFQALSPEQQKLILALTAIAALAGPVILFFGNMIVVVGAAAAALGGMTLAMAGATAGISLLVAGLAAIWWGTNKAEAGISTATTAAEVYAEELENLSGKNGQEAQQAARTRLAQARQADQMRENAEAAAKSATEYSAAAAAQQEAALSATGLSTSSQELLDRLKALGSEDANKGGAGGVAKKVVRLSAATRQMLQEINEMSVGMDNGGELVAQFAREVLAAGNITEETAKGVEDLARAVRQDLDRALSDANRRLDDAQQAFNDYANSIAQGIRGGNLFSGALSAQSDAQNELTAAEKAYNEAVKSRDRSRIKETLAELKRARSSQRTFLDFLATGVTTAEGFAGQIDALRTSGASLQVLQQIAELGVDTGGRIASELLAGGAAAIEQANRMVTAVDNASRRAGESAAQQFFGAGVNAAREMVRGIEATIPELQGVLDRIADAIERAMGARPNVDITGKQGPFIPQTAGVPGLPAPKKPTSTARPGMLAPQMGRVGEVIPQGQIRMFADGGLVLGPTLGMVGEAGPELVVPLDRMGNLGGETNVYITVTSADPQAVIDALRRYTRTNGPLGQVVAV